MRTFPVRLFLLRLSEDSLASHFQTLLRRYLSILEQQTSFFQEPELRFVFSWRQLPATSRLSGMIIRRFRTSPSRISPFNEHHHTDSSLQEELPLSVPSYDSIRVKFQHPTLLNRQRCGYLLAQPLERETFLFYRISTIQHKIQMKLEVELTAQFRRCRRSFWERTTLAILLGL